MSGHFSFLQFYLMAVCGMSLAIGCSAVPDDAPPKAKTAGKVTFQGEPIQNGMIRFIPDVGAPVQTVIVQGEYLIDYKGGVPLGKARVEIDGFRETGEMASVGPDKTVPESVQFLPDQYNKKSTLVVEITGDILNRHDFRLD